MLANFGLLVALMCGRLVQQIFFGTLRPVEVEVGSCLFSDVLGLTPHKRLYDRMWFFVTESLLAFTIFRDEFDIPLAVMFGFLLFVKSFHWLLADRIEWVQTMLVNRSTVYSLSTDEPNALSWADHLVPHTNQWIIFHVMDYKHRDVSVCRGKYSNQWGRSHHSICE